jgi:TRAP-type C4-dicarboxylate transport system permease small subunit
VTPAPEGGKAGRLERLIFSASRAWAVLGGLVLMAVVMMTVASVLMRAILGAPILGDYELVEMGSAIAAFSFLPYCQQTRGHVAVDIFTQRAPAHLNAALAAVGSLLLLVIALVLFWRMIWGGYDFHQYHERTTNLGIPRWWAFPPILISLALLALVSLATFAREAREALAGRA